MLLLLMLMSVAPLNAILAQMATMVVQDTLMFLGPMRGEMKQVPTLGLLLLLLAPSHQLMLIPGSLLITVRHISRSPLAILPRGRRTDLLSSRLSASLVPSKSVGSGRVPTCRNPRIHPKPSRTAPARPGSVNVGMKASTPIMPCPLPLVDLTGKIGIGTMVACGASLAVDVHGQSLGMAT